eukprot:TRINITY_DN7565_c0_g2_i2.p1 TRINITY_DN7565_c0_g2~~TRINITY_DN7565_c0_g2_i2.p1  ORF type:complete len:253 (-),score=28.05 TRINITY_DN7565_c0_g2_i2:409-1107(-)
MCIRDRRRVHGNSLRSNTLRSQASLTPGSPRKIRNAQRYQANLGKFIDEQLEIKIDEMLEEFLGDHIEVNLFQDSRVSRSSTIGGLSRMLTMTSSSYVVYITPRLYERLKAEFRIREAYLTEQMQMLADFRARPAESTFIKDQFRVIPIELIGKSHPKQSRSVIPYDLNKPHGKSNKSKSIGGISENAKRKGVVFPSRQGPAAKLQGKGVASRTPYVKAKKSPRKVNIQNCS